MAIQHYYVAVDRHDLKLPTLVELMEALAAAAKAADEHHRKSSSGGGSSSSSSDCGGSGSSSSGVGWRTGATHTRALPLAIFCSSRDTLDATVAALSSSPRLQGLVAVSFLHSDQSEEERAAVLAAFRTTVDRWRGVAPGHEPAAPAAGPQDSKAALSSDTEGHGVAAPESPVSAAAAAAAASLPSSAWPASASSSSPAAGWAAGADAADFGMRGGAASLAEPSGRDSRGEGGGEGQAMAGVSVAPGAKLQILVTTDVCAPLPSAGATAGGFSSSASVSVPPSSSPSASSSPLVVFGGSGAAGSVDELPLLACAMMSVDVPSSKDVYARRVAGCFSSSVAAKFLRGIGSITSGRNAAHRQQKKQQQQLQQQQVQMAPQQLQYQQQQQQLQHGAQTSLLFVSAPEVGCLQALEEAMGQPVEEMPIDICDILLSAP